ncbi:hypothetical protein [Pseudomonas sichuanensis]|uniref:hypothetical protein n=1 Tax=Pseudomonas sichuanensis TaxID=2213015 RepID=UPI0036E5894A
MNDTNQMVSVPSELLEQALDAAAAVGMQDVADELDRILTPKAEQDQAKPVAWVIFDNGFIDDHTTDKDLATGWHEQGLAVCALYDHADSGEVELLRDANLHHRNLQIEADDLIKSLHTQLGERDALLTKMKTLFRADDPFDLYDALCSVLTVGTGPSAHTGFNENAEFEKWWHATKCGERSTFAAASSAWGARAALSASAEPGVKP